MIIGIDGNEANIKNRVGVNVFAFEVLKNLNKSNIVSKKHTFVIYLQEKPLGDLPKEGKFWKYKVLPGKRLWILTRLMPHLLFNPDRPDVFFSPNHYVPLATLTPIVCSIMDLGFLKDKGQFTKRTFWQLKYWTAISVNVSKYIISISKATKKDIVDQYGTAPKKVEVAYLGYNKKVFNTKVSEKLIAKVKNKYKTGEDYILFIGTLKPSKNVEGILDAYTTIAKSVAPNNKQIPKLVIAGKKGWHYDLIYSKVKKSGLKNKVIFTDFFPERLKPALMAGARLLVSPSFTEGFGLHAVEAMAVGTPVVVSNVMSFPEVVGDAGILVDPKSVKSITKGVEKVLNMDEKRYNKQVALGLRQAGKFDWGKTAMDILRVIEKAN